MEERRKDFEKMQDWPPEWWALVTLKEASKKSTLSVDSIKRHHRHLIINLSPRRQAMRLGHVYTLGRARR
jgi:hypothetical protein